MSRGTMIALALLALEAGAYLYHVTTTQNASISRAHAAR
jgi:hypothetical protein